MIIRPENKTDYQAIYALVQTAFKTAKVSSGDEQNFVNRLRESENYIPELALVAEAEAEKKEEKKLIGHVMLTRTNIETDNGAFGLLLLAPLAVVLDRRGKGVGGELLENVCMRAKELGHRAVTLVGDPAYYQRFGFKPAITFGIKNTNGIPSQYVMARELVPEALCGTKGSISFQT